MAGACVTVGEMCDAEILVLDYDIRDNERMSSVHRRMKPFFCHSHLMSTPGVGARNCALPILVESSLVDFLFVLIKPTPGDLELNFDNIPMHIP